MARDPKKLDPDEQLTRIEFVRLKIDVYASAQVRFEDNSAQPCFYARVLRRTPLMRSPEERHCHVRQVVGAQPPKIEAFMRRALLLAHLSQSHEAGAIVLSTEDAERIAAWPKDSDDNLSWVPPMAAKYGVTRQRRGPPSYRHTDEAFMPALDRLIKRREQDVRDGVPQGVTPKRLSIERAALVLAAYAPGGGAIESRAKRLERHYYGQQRKRPAPRQDTLLRS